MKEEFSQSKIVCTQINQKQINFAIIAKFAISHIQGDAQAIQDCFAYQTSHADNRHTNTTISTQFYRPVSQYPTVQPDTTTQPQHGQYTDLSK